MCKILFDPGSHTYRRQSDGMLYMSVTHMVKQFQPEFQGDHHAKKRAAKKCIGPKKYQILYDLWTTKNEELAESEHVTSGYFDLRQMAPYLDLGDRRHTLMPEFIAFLEAHIPNWQSYEEEQARVHASFQEKREAGASAGTAHHDWMEGAAIRRGEEINEHDGKYYPVMPHGKEIDGTNRNIVDRLDKLPPGCYLELMIWYDFPDPVWSNSMQAWIAGICGQEDKVIILPEGQVDTFDHKRTKNKKLDDFGVRYRNLGFEKMLFPFDKWRVHDKNVYTFQLNIYAWMLAQAHSLPPRSITILHKDEVIPIGYWPSLVSTSINMVASMGL